MYKSKEFNFVDGVIIKRIFPTDENTSFLCFSVCESNSSILCFPEEKTF